MKKLLTLLITIIVLISPIQVIANESLFCESPELVQCIGVTKNQCKKAINMSFELCSEYFGINDKSIEEVEKEIEKVAACSINQFKLISSISDTELKACNKHIVMFMKNELIKVKNNSSSLNKLLNEDDPLHMQSK